MCRCLRRLLSVLILTCLLACRSTDPCPPDGSQPAIHPTSSHDDGSPCLRIAEVRADTPPPDLYRASSSCVIAERYLEALELLELAEAFVAFDAQRQRGVKPGDVTSSLLREFHSGIPIDRQSGLLRFTREMKHTPRELRQELRSDESLCAELSRAGPPTYEPDYLAEFLEPGICLGEGSRPRSDFNPSKAWGKAIAGLGYCRPTSR